MSGVSSEPEKDASSQQTKLHPKAEMFNREQNRLFLGNKRLPMFGTLSLKASEKEQLFIETLYL